MRRAVQCVAAVEVRGSGYTIGRLNSVSLIPRGGKPGNIVPLRMRDGGRGLLLGLYHHYTVVHAPDDPDGGSYRVISSRYMYELLDREQRELFVSHWHPEGVSPIRFPHLHVSGAPPIVVPPLPKEQRSREVALNKAHFPTGPTAIEEFVVLLIRDFEIASRRDDWSEVLAESGSSIRRAPLR